jgi:hypothetical protein
VRHLFGPAPHADALFWINAHALAGLGVLVVYWQAWQARRRNPHILDTPAVRRGYLAWLGTGAALTVLTGWLGGHLVYVLGIGVR